MRFIHSSDLHLGKALYERSLHEDQCHAIDFIVQAAVDSKADAVLIPGDVYNRPNPPAESVQLFSRFISGLNRAGI